MGRVASTMLVALLAVYPAVASAQDEEKPTASAAGTVSLRDVLRMAVKASPDQKLAEARVARAEAEAELAMSGYLPRLEAGVRGGAGTERSTFLFRQNQFVVNSAHAEARGGLRWTALDFGHTSNAVSAADASQASAERGRDATHAAVVRHAAELYVSVLFDEQLVLSKRTAVKHRTRFLAVAKGLVSQGVRPALDEARARVNLDSAKHDLTAAEARLAVDRARLAILVGLEPDRLPSLAPALLPGAEDDGARAAAASERRPEVGEAAASVEASDHRVDSAWAMHLPRVEVDVSGSYRLTQYDYADKLLPRAEASGMLSITVPLFDTSIGARVDAARAELGAARAREEAVRRRVRLEAYEAALQLKGARALKARARELATNASAALSVVEARYASGLATSLELVDAEQADLEAREALLSAELRVQLATVQVLAASGKAPALEGT
ncbi:MAG: TolC family protein [Deltaproteobacteria bacterium]|nr:TolC family protein [Deltaproteobacteria bacterium]